MLVSKSMLKYSSNQAKNHTYRQRRSRVSWSLGLNAAAANEAPSGEAVSGIISP